MLGMESKTDSRTKETGSVLIVQSLSHVRLFVTPWTAAHQAPLSMGFTRQNIRMGGHSLLHDNSLKFGES